MTSSTDTVDPLGQRILPDLSDAECEALCIRIEAILADTQALAEEFKMPVNEATAVAMGLHLIGELQLLNRFAPHGIKSETDAMMYAIAALRGKIIRTQGLDGAAAFDKELLATTTLLTHQSTETRQEFQNKARH